MTDHASPAGAQRRTVGILIFDDVEVLDFCGPFEVFSVSRGLGGDGTRDEAAVLFDVLTIAERPDPVRAVGGLTVLPAATIADHPALDIVVVPGGRGTRREMTNPAILGWIAAQRSQAELTTSVCTGSFLLGANGLLDGLGATTHWASIDRLREIAPAATVHADQRVVDEGAVVTSAGISAGIDMALHVVARLHGEATATATARTMEYDGDWRSATTPRP